MLASLKTRSLGQDAALVAGAAAIITAGSHVEVPFIPVPMTLQTLAVLGAGLTLGLRRGGAAVATFLAMGAAGLPVFAGGKAGLLVFTGPTGGYLLGFLIAALFCGFAADRGWTRTLLGALATAFVGAALVYPTGLWQLGAVVGWDKPVLAWGLTPFLFGDAVKAVIAGLGAYALARRSNV